MLPAEVARAARAAADARGKPLLNVGAGTPGTSLRVAVFGPFMPGDVNCDLGGSGACGPSTVCRCDAHALPYRSGQFGAVIASHVIEHVDDPARALAELARVADEVFVITPAWWAPHTWLHPGHQWYRRDDGRFIPLWRSDSDAPGYLGILP
jgi:SAM-dependent methyltransferase